MYSNGQYLRKTFLNGTEIEGLRVSTGSLRGVDFDARYASSFVLIDELGGHAGISTLTVVNVSRNGRGALYKPLKLLTLKTRKMHLNRPFKVLHSLHLLTDKPYMQ